MPPPNAPPEYLPLRKQLLPQTPLPLQRPLYPLSQQSSSTLSSARCLHVLPCQSLVLSLTPANEQFISTIPIKLHLSESPLVSTWPNARVTSQASSCLSSQHFTGSSILPFFNIPYLASKTFFSSELTTISPAQTSLRTPKSRLHLPDQHRHLAIQKARWVQGSRWPPAPNLFSSHWPRLGPAPSLTASPISKARQSNTQLRHCLFSPSRALLPVKQVLPPGVHACPPLPGSAFHRPQNNTV